MSTTYLRNTILLLVGAFFTTAVAVMILFLPLVSSIQQFTAGNRTASAHAPGPLPIAVSVLAVVVAGAALAATIKGIIRASSKKWAWAILSILALLIFVQAVSFAFAAPKFAQLLADLRA